MKRDSKTFTEPVTIYFFAELVPDAGVFPTS